MTKEEAINVLIKDCDTNKISDGYHTFGELYEHRITLFIALCRARYGYEQSEGYPCHAWKSLYHSDGSKLDGWFIAGLYTKPGEQITYHIPISKWDECDFMVTRNMAPEWDGHTSDDVLKRLAEL